MYSPFVYQSAANFVVEDWYVFHTCSTWLTFNMLLLMNQVTYSEFYALDYEDVQSALQETFPRTWSKFWKLIEQRIESLNRQNKVYLKLTANGVLRKTRSRSKDEIAPSKCTNCSRVCEKWFNLNDQPDIRDEKIDKAARKVKGVVDINAETSKVHAQVMVRRQSIISGKEKKRQSFERLENDDDNAHTETSPRSKRQEDEGNGGKSMKKRTMGKVTKTPSDRSSVSIDVISDTPEPSESVNIQMAKVNSRKKGKQNGNGDAKGDGTTDLNGNKDLVTDKEQVAGASPLKKTLEVPTFLKKEKKKRFRRKKSSKSPRSPPSMIGILSPDEDDRSSSSCGPENSLNSISHSVVPSIELESKHRLLGDSGSSEVLTMTNKHSSVHSRKYSLLDSQTKSILSD